LELSFDGADEAGPEILTSVIGYRDEELVGDPKTRWNRGGALLFHRGPSLSE